MGSILDFFTVKSAKQRAREQKQFDQWAFPYGDAQKEKIFELVKALLPKEDTKAAVAVFLIGRQAYRGAYNDDPDDLKVRTEAEKQAALDRILRSQLFGRYKKFIPYYKALVIADDQVDETLNYPPVEELRRMAEELANEK